jgi:predicted DNA-binding transcriptional regulator AlpA
LRTVGRKVDVEELVGASEIASRLGYKRTVYVHDLRRRYPEFPRPVADLTAGLVWVWADVEAWGRATGRIG